MWSCQSGLDAQDDHLVLAHREAGLPAIVEAVPERVVYVLHGPWSLARGEQDVGIRVDDLDPRLTGDVARLRVDRHGSDCVLHRAYLLASDGAPRAVTALRQRASWPDHVSRCATSCISRRVGWPV